MADVDVQVELVAAPQISVELLPAVQLPVSLASDIQINVDVAARGPIGDPGVGVPIGGTTGQVLAKASGTDYDAEWVEQTGGGGGGAVDSVNGQTGVVVLDADDIDDTSTTQKFVTASDLTKLGNLSGTNTGDQDLSSYATTASLSNYVPTTRTVNTKALSSNITLNQDDVLDGTTYKQYSSTEKTKLSGIATGATANSSDATLLARTNHTGTQAISTVTGLQTALDGKSDTSHTHTLDNLSDVTVTAPSVGQVIKYNGTGWINDDDATSGGGAGATNLSTTLSSAQTVINSDTGTDATIPAVDGTNAGVMTPIMKTKLDGIESAADVTDATNVAASGAFMKAADDMDDITDGATYVKYSATEKSKLAGVASGATANTGDMLASTYDPIGISEQLVGTTATQVLVNKDLTSGTNTFPTFNQNTTGSAASLTTGRTFRTNLASTSTATFNGTANVTPGVTGTLPVGNGGTGATTLTSGNYLKGNGTSALTSSTPASVAAEIGALLWPVGAIYYATVSTNPATLLGFGTWTAYGAGRVIVGKAAAGTFATAGATGGAETHTLTIAEMPSHNHPALYGSSAGGNYARATPNTSTDANSPTTNDTVKNTGGGGAHNNLQPYIVAYIWERTA